MQEIILPPTYDTESLKTELEEKKKKYEYERLKNELYELNLKENNELTEFQGGLKEVDTTQILKTKNRTLHMADLIVSGFMKMMSPRPVARNILAIALIAVSVFILLHFLNIKQLEHYKQLGNIKLYLVNFIEIAAAVQILKSSTRSMPVVATLAGALISNSMTDAQLVLMHPQLFYQILMCVGILGVTISAFTID